MMNWGFPHGADYAYGRMVYESTFSRYNLSHAFRSLPFAFVGSSSRAGVVHGAVFHSY